MPECIINGVPINFPFEPYDVQKEYMSKVIECLQNGTNGMLESPTGTGKTLSLLCSTLAWIITKKAQVSMQGKQLNLGQDIQNQYDNKPLKTEPIDLTGEPPKEDLIAQLNAASGSEGSNWGVPKVIYASRTHSQLTQAMQELKRSSYNYVKAVALGSRDQLCIHPEVSKESNNSAKVQLCKLHVLTRTCTFYAKVEANKSNPQFLMQSVMDIEDLVSSGKKLRMCPYYAAKELVQNADIIFMPYNYLLDPSARKANKIDLNNTIVILDEAHNVEKMCEESASIQLKSSDIALCIDDITHIMRALSTDAADADDNAKDFNIEDLALLKQMLMDFEKAIDDIEISKLGAGSTFPGGYIFELLAKAEITHQNQAMVNRLFDSLVQYLTAASQNNPAFRKGGGFQLLSDLLTIVFAGKDGEHDEKLKRSFKTHVEYEETKQQRPTTRKDGWITPRAPASTNSNAKIINYWCFNPGFGMEQLLKTNVRSIILTSGTLAPLKPLIAELGIPIAVRLENPHIVSKSQVCVKIVPFGPDKEPLNSNYNNRDNVKYVSSLGRTILSFCPIIPDGLLIFFPSYPVMNKCVDSWQASGIWSQINRLKKVFVEPRGKDAFNTTMAEFYETIKDPSTKGACFMAVCRGKVSEGLDFADMNGRAVIVTGLPFPPLKDARVILKKKYLEDNRTKENELLTGTAWYGLEAIRAVNQAIGRVIRHKNDYGAILLCDERFSSLSQRSQLSSWIQSHLNNSQHCTNFGQFIGEISRFFRNAENTTPKPCLRELNPVEAPITESLTNQSDPTNLKSARIISAQALATAIKMENANEVSSWHPNEYKSLYKNIRNPVPNSLDFISRLDENVSTIDFNKAKAQSSSEHSPQVKIHKREPTSPSALNSSETIKRRKFKIVANDTCCQDIASSSRADISCTSITQQTDTDDDKSIPLDRTELLKLIKNSIPTNLYSIFVKALMSYQKDDQISNLMASLVEVFEHPNLEYLLKGMRRFVRELHKVYFDEYLDKRRI